MGHGMSWLSPPNHESLVDIPNKQGICSFLVVNQGVTVFTHSQLNVLKTSLSVFEFFCSVYSQRSFGFFLLFPGGAKRWIEPTKKLYKSYEFRAIAAVSPFGVPTTNGAMHRRPEHRFRPTPTPTGDDALRSVRCDRRSSGTRRDPRSKADGSSMCRTKERSHAASIQKGARGRYRSCPKPPSNRCFSGLSTLLDSWCTNRFCLLIGHRNNWPPSWQSRCHPDHFVGLHLANAERRHAPRRGWVRTEWKERMERAAFTVIPFQPLRYTCVWHTGLDANGKGVFFVATKTRKLPRLQFPDGGGAIEVQRRVRGAG